MKLYNTYKPNVLSDVIEKALLGGFYPHLQETVEDYYRRKDQFPREYRDYLDGMRMYLLKTHSLPGLLFDRNFAVSVGYTLEDLGRWCDSGRLPLDYLVKYFT